MIDLLEARLSVAETTMANLITGGLYSDGTANGGKQIDGLQKALPADPTAAVYGGIDGNQFPFWRNRVVTPTTVSPASILGDWNALWATLVRGQDRPDLIMVDNTLWGVYMDSLQQNQRFANTNTADAGFLSLKFMDADVVLDGGIYFPSATTGATGIGNITSYFLNTDYIHYRPHARRNMTALSPSKRYAINQDASVNLIGWAGNLTMSGRIFHGLYAPVALA